MSTGVSQLYAEEGQMWLRASSGHAISAQWLQEQAPDLSAEWWAAPSVAARDQLALRIEQRLEELESADSWDTLTAACRQRPDSALAQKVTDYEAQARQLGATPLDRAGRDQTHRADQAHGDRLRAEIAGQATPEPDQLLARLDAADLNGARAYLSGDEDINLTTRTATCTGKFHILLYFGSWVQRSHKVSHALLASVTDRGSPARALMSRESGCAPPMQQLPP